MVYSFGDCMVNVDTRELYRNGAPVAIRSQAFDVLIHLIEHRDHVVSVHELCGQLWAPRVVSDSTLISCIKEVRRAVGDNGQAQKIIRTIHGHGYRFVAPLNPGGPVPTLPGEMISGSKQQESSSPETESDQWPDGESRGNTGPSSTQPTPLAPARFETEPRTRSTAGEYKPVTVLVCGLADAKALTAKLGPEAIHRLMQQFVSVALEAIQRFGGTVRRILNDGVEALFGAPSAQEDHCNRAVRAALALRQRWHARLVDSKTNGENQVAVAFGVHTGQIILGPSLANGLHQIITAIGNTFELAHQLRRWAGPDTIFLSEKTMRHARGIVHAEAIEMQSAVASPPLTVYRVCGMRSLRSPLQVLGKHTLSRFVGRESELAELGKLWNRVKQCCGQVVGITAEAGLGKSRLLYEFHRSLKRERPNYLEGRCVPYGRATPYLPVLDLLRHCCSIVETDTAETVTAKVRDGLLKAGMDAEESAMYLLYLLGVSEMTDPLINLSPHLLKSRTFETLTKLFISHSRQHPCVIEIEDLQWIDATSEEFLRAFAGQLIGIPILLLASYRPPYQPPWMGKSFSSQFTLRPLDSASSLTVLRGVLKAATVPESLVLSMLRTAEGNPFFLEELAWAAMEHGEQGSLLTVPDTVQGVLLGRIDRLFPEIRWLLQVAAVLGKEQSLSLLREVAELPEEAFRDRLEQLQITELLYTTSLLPESGYTFKHAMTQEAAYQSLLQSTRREYHRRIAEILELRFPETPATHPELLAHHYSKAGCNSQAVCYWLQAAQRSLERSADTEAIELLTLGLQALETLPEEPERFQQELTLRCTLGIALVRIKGYAAQDVEQNYSRAQELCDQFKDLAPISKVVFGLWMFYGVSGAIPTALKLARQLVKMAHEGDTAQFIYAHALMGITLSHHGAMTTALEHFDEAIARYDQSQQRELCIQYGQDCGFACLLYSAHILWCLGYPERALRRERKALELVQNISHPFSEASFFYFSAWNHIYHRDIQTVLTRAEKAIHLSTEQGFPHWLAGAKVVHGWALVQNGAGEQGIVELEEGVARCSANGANLGLNYFLILLAESHGKVGKPDVGLGILAKASRLGCDNDEHFYDAELSRIKGELLLQQAVPDQYQAEVCFREAMRIARSQKAKSLELRAAMALYRLWQLGDKRDEGYQLLDDVYNWFTEGFDSPDLEDAKTLLGKNRIAPVS